MKCSLSVFFLIKNHIFLAAHCFNYDFPIIAQLGRHNFTDLNEKGWIQRKIIKKIIHSDYSKSKVFLAGQSRGKSDADIAILIMNEAVTFTDYIQPICLPSAAINAFDTDGIVAGHGIINIVSRDISKITKHAAMKTSSLDECYASNKDSTIIVSTRSFCAKGNLTAPCQGKFKEIFLECVQLKKLNIQ